MTVALRAALVLALLALAAGPGSGGAAAGAAQRLDLDARVVWSNADPDFGGFSGVEMAEDGSRFAAISDRGHWATGEVDRADGRLVAVRTTGFGPLLGVKGAPLGGDDVDAEGLAAAPGGGYYVSFENNHRIRLYRRLDAAPEQAPGHPDFKRLQDNSALEAIATGPDGALYAIPERSGKLDRPFPVYRYADGRWTNDLSLPRSGTFLVSGADFGPDGRLYVLERDFTWMGGFATRVRSYALGPDGFDDGRTLLETGFGSTDNFEGISVWRDASGTIRATLIADDNFFALQSTALAEYRLVGG